MDLKLTTHFKRYAAKEFLLKGRLYHLFQLRSCQSYRIDDKNNVYLYLNSIGEIQLKKLPYQGSYYADCHNIHDGYHIKHPYTQKSVKKDIYSLYIETEKDSLTLATKNEGDRESILQQIDSVSHRPDKIIYFDNNPLIDLNEGYMHMSLYTEIRTFENIIAYENFETEISINEKG